MRLGIEVNYFHRLASSSGQAERKRPARRMTRDASAISLHDKQLTENWRGQGESDCLIKTKHCESPRGFSRNVISAQCSECHGDEIQ